ncbi:MAG TPA: hypothetical protein VMH26_10975 [Burkholderiales bacterium]|nr:hypothetical protein [Burkholderiales bacterium]
MFGDLLRPSRLFCLVVLLALAASAAGGGSEAPGSSAGFMFDEDYFGAGGDVELDQRVEGDAALAGGRIAVRGPVKGDVLLAGGDISVTDTIGKNLYAAGGSIAISSQVAGNARLAGGQVTISHRGGIAGKASIAAASVQMAGRVGRYLAVYAESVRIDGEVGDDLRVVARFVEIGPEAKIGGKLIYRSPQPAQIAPSAVIAGGVTQLDTALPGAKVHAIARAATWISLFVVLLSLLLVGAIMILAFPEFSADAVRIVRSDPWKALGLGFALLLCLPAAAAVFLISVIGVPVGVALLLFYPVMLLFGYITGALFLGDAAGAWVARRRARTFTPGWRYLALAIALLALLLVSEIPFVGGIAHFLVLLFGLGAFWICAYRRYLRKSPPPGAAGLGIDLA